MRIGVIGVGRIGRLHAENLAFRIPEAEVSAVADVRREAAERCAAELGIPKAFEDYHAILEDSSIQAVVIASSTETHAQIIEEAAEAGKHIFCEKPIALDLGAIDRALAAVARSGVLLQVGFNRRFDPSFRRARELIAQGAIGTPHVLKITSRDPNPPPIDYLRVSGGIFLDMTIHDFDMARFLLGDEVEEVFATGAVLVDPKIGALGDIDTAIVTLRFRRGTLSVIDNSRKAVYGYDQRIEVFGTGGMVTVGNRAPDEVHLADKEGIHGSLPLFFFTERYGESYIAEMKTFIECISKGQQPPVTGLDGRMAVVIGYAAKCSYKERRPIRLVEIDPHLV